MVCPLDKFMQATIKDAAKRSLKQPVFPIISSVLTLFSSLFFPINYFFACHYDTQIILIQQKRIDLQIHTNSNNYSIKTCKYITNRNMICKWAKKIA